MTLRSDYRTDRTWHEEVIETDSDLSYKINCMARRVDPGDGGEAIEVRWCEVWRRDVHGADRVASFDTLSDSRLFVRAKIAAA